ncbi:hypothetical protein DBR11_14370 [Pedobacter sp. HMWF019]|uniref:hypothetical protein n=1 Tax=Pedobacter sp. HMWF019 TaxID=2056856 RepID=UPI000D37F07C|nr:hypothetical protein [Pedobacter sp. HMWF019]PTS98626.1 hypothetical protein DBR11_14370 [Pedobacter sp. HMWF019]
MDLEKFEYVIFAAILIGQGIFFNRTRKKIKEFNNSIANISSIGIADLELTEEQVDSFSLRDDIFDIAKKTETTGMASEEHIVNQSEEEVDSENLSERAPDIEQSYQPTVKLRLLESTDNSSLVFNNILNALNKYLLRNRHSVADFNLIKDIVERNTNTIEEDVNLTLSTPLYLGLMGTMLGVVIGIFSMSNFIGAQLQEDSISGGIAILLGSVKIAMIASCLGLLLTIYNSAIIFKGSKYRLESKKNDFYTMIQVELLPSLNQGMNATFDSLQRNLFRFNEKFDNNLDKLSTVFDKNYDSIVMQKNLVEQMDRSKVADITKFNIKVLAEMSTSLAQFDKFNMMFSNINTYLSNSYKLAERSNELLERTGNFEKIASAIEENLDNNTHLTRFLSEHFNQLEEHKSKIDEAVVGIGFNIKDTFEQLKGSLQNSSQILGEEAMLRNAESKKLFNDFSNELKESFTIQANSLQEIMEEKKSSLDHLKHLEALLSEVKSMRGGNEMTDKLSGQIFELNSGISNTNDTLRRIEQDAKKPFFKKLFNQKYA